MTSNSNKLIKNNVDYIISLFCKVAKIQIEENNFKVAKDDFRVYFTKHSKSLFLEYNLFEDVYYIYDENLAGNRGKHHYHEQFKSDSLVGVSLYLKTLHSPKDMNNKKDSVSKMFEKLNNPQKYRVSLK